VSAIVDLVWNRAWVHAGDAGPPSFYSKSSHSFKNRLSRGDMGICRRFAGSHEKVSEAVPGSVCSRDDPMRRRPITVRHRPSRISILKEAFLEIVMALQETTPRRFAHEKSCYGMFVHRLRWPPKPHTISGVPPEGCDIGQLPHWEEKDFVLRNHASRRLPTPGYAYPEGVVMADGMERWHRPPVSHSIDLQSIRISLVRFLTFTRTVVNQVDEAIHVVRWRK